MENLKYYYEIDYSLLSFVQNNLRIDNQPIELYGSAMNKNLNYINDYDFFCRMKKKKYNEDIIIENLKLILGKFNFNNFIFMELKIQYLDQNKIKILPRQKLNINNLDIDNIDFIKVDFAYKFNDVLKECSINYKFGDPHDKNRKNEILDNLKKQYKNKNYFKYLKRLLSLNHKNKKVVNLLIPFFNSDISGLYTVTQNLELLLKLKELYPLNNEIKLSIAQNLILLGYKPKQKIKVLITNLLNFVNEKTLLFIKNNNLVYKN
jgi:hypothetical protein